MFHILGLDIQFFSKNTGRSANAEPTFQHGRKSVGLKFHYPPPRLHSPHYSLLPHCQPPPPFHVFLQASEFVGPM